MPLGPRRTRHPLVRGLCVAALLVSGDAAAADVIDYAAIRATKRVAALRIDEPIVIDGRLDERAWERAEVAREFIQQQPQEGATTTEPSEIRFLYDADTLYVGGSFLDSDPRGGITNELTRDFSARDGDLITLVLDTFHDQRNAFNFMINPAGALRDSQSYDDGRQNNPDWDGIWFVKTAQFGGGWSMEMAIPFKTLRFKDAEEQTWGLNIFRLIRRKNEITLWAPVPRQFGQFKVSYAGVLTGIQGVHPGRNLRFKPFTTAQVSRKASGARQLDGDGGFDLKYGLGTALSLDLTYRTDFSQVEADDQQINLTRFSLFLPEKREFFLENQGSFRIGDIDLAQGARAFPLMPFFSRRIGVADDGSLVPIVVGARLSGKQGAYSLGLLQMHTDEVGSRPGERFTAARVSRDIGVTSSMSGFYFGRESSGADPYTRVVGGDVHLNFRRTIDVDGFLLRSASPEGRDGSAGRAALNIKENRYTAHLSYTSVSPDFRNDLGFTPRRDIGQTSWEFRWNLRPRGGTGPVRLFAFGTDGDAYANSRQDHLLSRVSRLAASAEFADGGVLAANVDWDYELLMQPFEISRGVIIPPGEYRFRQVVPSYSSNRSRWFSGNITYTGGEFWSGTIRGVDAGIRVRGSEKFAATASYGRHAIDLTEGGFSTEILRLRANYSFSTAMFLNGFVQYNSVSRTWTSNIRYRFIYRPLSDAFLVFNESRGPSGKPQRALIFKYTLLLAF